MAVSLAAENPIDPSRRPSGGRVSLVMATFRRTHCLGETARQLLDQQSRAPFELIVVNNDPAPGAEQAVRDALPADPRIRVTTCTTGRQGACRNHGLLMATGDYVAFVDDDDDYTPDYIARLAAALDAGVRSVRCQIQTCGCAGPDCNGRPTRAHHPLTPNTMARRDVLTPTWNDPPSEDRDYWSRHPIEGAIDDCLVITCQGPGRHSPRNNAQGGSWRVRFAISMLVSKADSRYLKASIASLQAQTYGNLRCVLIDQSADQAVAALLPKLTANDHRFSIVQPETPYRDGIDRALAGGTHDLTPDDVLLLLHGNERLAHPGVLNRLAHVYTEQDEVWVTYGGCATEPLTPSWPQASFPPAVWRSRTFRAVSTLIGEYAPLTMRAPFLGALQSSVSSADSAAPLNSPVDADERELPLFLLALEAAGSAHVYPMAETQVIKGLEKPVYRDATQRRESLARQFEIRNRPPAAPIDSLEADEHGGSVSLPAATPYPLDQPRSLVLLYHPDWHGDEWQVVVHHYVQRFSHEHDVSLVLLLDPAQGFSEAWVGQRIAELRAHAGRTDADMPDLLLVTDVLDAGTMAGLYLAANVVVLSAEQAEGIERARAAGLDVLSPTDADAWQLLADGIVSRPIARHEALVG